MPRRGVVEMRGSMVTRLRLCMVMSTPHPPPTPCWAENGGGIPPLGHFPSSHPTGQVLLSQLAGTPPPLRNVGEKNPFGDIEHLSHTFRRTELRGSRQHCGNLLHWFKSFLEGLFFSHTPCVRGRVPDTSDGASMFSVPSHESTLSELSARTPYYGEP